MKKLFLLMCVCCSMLSMQAVELKNQHLCIELASEARGGGLRKITDVKTNSAFFCSPVMKPLMWSIRFANPAEKKLPRKSNDAQFALFTRELDENLITVTNRDARRCRIKAGKNVVAMYWSGLDIGKEKNVLIVKLTIVLNDDGTSVWTLVPELRSKNYTYAETVFPDFEKAINPKSEKILFPFGNYGSRLSNVPMWGVYPSWSSQVQFLGVYNDRGGLYVGIHDAQANKKSFLLTREMTLSVSVFSENTILPGRSTSPVFPVVIAPSEDPYDACAQYREWAVQQLWTKRGKLSRRNLPEAARNAEFWLRLGGGNNSVSQASEVAMRAAKFLPGIGISVHLYTWNKYPHDHHYPEMFPALPDMKAEVQRMKDAGMTVYPYLNARLWDTTLPSYQDVKDEVCCNIDQEPITEVYGKSPVLAPMCAARSPSMTRFMNENTQRLVDEYGANGLYIDQVASVKPTRCYNPKHNHPKGGGHWWHQAYRRMLGPIVKRNKGKVTFLAENAADVYMDLYDIFLLWGHLSTEDFPSLPIIYNQYAWYISSGIDREDTTDAYVAIMSRSLRWNVKPGWHATWLFTHSNVVDLDFKRNYLKELLNLKKHLKYIVENGNIVGETAFEKEPAKVDMTFIWTTWNPKTNPPKRGPVASLQSTVWLTDDLTKMAVIVTEVSGKETQNVIQIPMQKNGFSTAGKKLYRLMPDGQKKPLELPADGKMNMTFAPYEMVVLVIE